MSQHPNHLFRYLAEENLVSSENIARLEKIMTLPIEEAESFTEDELNEDFDAMALPE